MHNPGVSLVFSPVRKSPVKFMLAAGLCSWVVASINAPDS